MRVKWWRALVLGIVLVSSVCACKKPPTVRGLALGRDFGCALIADERRLSCWGKIDHHIEPRPIDLHETNVSSMALGDNGSMCIMHESNASCRHVFAGQESPGFVAVPALLGARHVLIREQDVCATVDNEHAKGALVCLSRGVDGAGHVKTLRENAVVDFAATATELFTLQTDGNVQRIDAQGVAAPIKELAQVHAISAGKDHVCAVFEDGAVKCWGGNAFGQLGDGTQTPRPIPTAVAGLVGAESIGCGDGFTCVLLRDGTVSCFGDNRRFQIATSEGTSITRPSPVFGILAAGGVAVGPSGACAWLGKQEGARCWGDNHDETLGNAAKDTSRVPMPIRFPK